MNQLAPNLNSSQPFGQKAKRAETPKRII